MSQNDSGSVQKVKTIKHCKTMKKLVFLLLTCLAAMAMQAQVLTSKTIIDVYDEVSMNGEPGFAYNADYAADGTIETMYVYQRRKDTLKPLYQFRYVYSPDGLLLTRTTLCWRYGKWLTASRSTTRSRTAATRWTTVATPVAAAPSRLPLTEWCTSCCPTIRPAA